MGWGSAQVIGALALGTLLVAGFIAWERRVPAPMLPSRMLRNRTFAAANATGFLMMGSITSAAFLMSQFFQLGLGYSPLATGLRFLPWTATPLLVAPLAGRLVDKVGARPLMVVGMAVQAGRARLDGHRGHCRRGLRAASCCRSSSPGSASR